MKTQEFLLKDGTVMRVDLDSGELFARSEDGEWDSASLFTSEGLERELQEMVIALLAASVRSKTSKRPNG